jgi:two-component system, OmpR family, alkaline phosphatase synthesis response regulator PhoP
MEDRILVVDDEKSIADAIAYGLRREGYKVDTAYNGEEALKKVRETAPLIIILDVMMPKLNGFEVLKKLQSTEEMGIVLLTAKNDIVDKILGLELGADDYITKPFDIREVIARVKALIRRLQKNTQESAQEEITIDELKIVLDHRKVLIKEKEIELTPKEFDLLALLSANPGRVFTRDELLDKIWGMEYIGGTRTVDIHVRRVRQKLGEYEYILQTVHGVGYKATGDFYEKQY